MDAKFYREYYTLERSHWWFKARLEILRSILLKKLEVNTNLTILNIGAATGATSQMLNDFGEVISLEYDKTCCEILEEKTGIKAINGSMTELPFQDSSFDLVCAFDVIEHIEEDHKAVQEMLRVLKTEGNYFATVPAFNSLWSNHDVVNHHFRRYTKRSFNSLLSTSGGKLKYSSYFNFWLFFPIFCVRLILNILPKSKNTETSGSDNEVLNAGFINKVLYRVFLSEKLLIPNLKFPVGVSIMEFGKK